MKTLVLYGTRRGATEKTAEVIHRILTEEFRFDAELIDADETVLTVKALREYGAVIAGSSIMAGFWKGSVKKTLRRCGKADVPRVALFVSAGGSLNISDPENPSALREAEEKAVNRYIAPVAKRYRLSLADAGAFGGIMEVRGEVQFDSWREEPIRKWTRRVAEKFLGGSIA